MKKINKTAAAFSAIAASAMLTASAGAYLTEAGSPSGYLNSDNETWQFVLPEKHNSYAVGISKMEFVVTFDGDMDEYKKEKTDGYYDNDTGKAFADFEGYVGIGAVVRVNGVNDNWFSFSYKSLNPIGSGNFADIKKLNDNTYLFSCTLDNVEVLPTDRDIQLSFKEWANKSDYYRLTVQEFYAYNPDGTVAIYADTNGDAEFGTHPAFDPSDYGVVPEETTAAAETTEAAPEETTEASEATTAAPETTTGSEAAVSETTTASTFSAVTTKATTTKGGTVQTASSTDYGSRDSSLLIVGIVAGVLIIGLIVGIVIYMSKKKKH